jgi:hypothetical protein
MMVSDCIKSMNYYSNTIKATNQTNEQSVDFATILERAQKGETLTTQQIVSWENHQEESGQISSTPDEVEQAGMIRGYQPNFSDVSSLDLRNRLENLWNHCPSSSAKFKFMDMFQLNFAADQEMGGRTQWGSSWRNSLRENLDYTISLAGTASGEEKTDESEMAELLRKILEG